MQEDVRTTSLTQKRYDRQAAVYDLWDAPMELAFGGLRKRLWSDTRGPRLLEIGVGTGKNLRYHPENVRSIAVDLSPRMLMRAVRKADRLGRDVDFVLADAQHLPFRDGVFDAAVATFVFCSVPDPVRGLEEVRRVLRTDGRLSLLEHVRSRNPIVGKVMDWTNPLWVRLSGANINRDTVSNVENAGLELENVESHGFGILKLIRGRVSEKPSAEPAPAEEEAKRDVARG